MFVKLKERFFGNKTKVSVGRVTLKAPGNNRIEIVIGGLDPIQVAQVTNQIRYWYKAQRTNAGVDLHQFEVNMKVFEKAMDTLNRSMDSVFKGVFK